LRRIARSEDHGVLTIEFSDIQWLARTIAGAGAGALALDPPDLVDAVVERLRAAAGAG
jgi:predicted DNA-binding transcriptional regulator YafY